MKPTTVYWIRAEHHRDFKTEGYVGVTVKTAAQRYRQHQLAAASHENRSRIVEAAIRDGETRVETLCITDRCYALELERTLRPVPGIGWNVGTGGYAPAAGRPLSASAKRKISASHAFRKPWTAEARARLSAAHAGHKYNAGRVHGPEEIAKRAAALRGKVRTPEMRAAASARLKGTPVSAATRAAANARKTCPHCSRDFNLGNYARFHGGRCKLAPDFDAL